MQQQTMGAHRASRKEEEDVGFWLFARVLVLVAWAGVCMLGVMVFPVNQGTQCLTDCI